MRNVSTCAVAWQRGAVLQRLGCNSHELMWVGEKLYGGTVSGAVSFFKMLPPQQQERIEMFVNRGVISALGDETIVGADVLRTLAGRADRPA
jgi:hypothetical protein